MFVSYVDHMWYVFKYAWIFVCTQFREYSSHKMLIFSEHFIYTISISQ